MNTLTLKIPDALNEALTLASQRRQISKSAMVRESLEKTLAEDLQQAGCAAMWVARWRGTLKDSSQSAQTDARLAHLLAKHVH